MVYVEFQDGPSSYYHCTGSLIDASHVVTAADCFYTEAGALAQASQVTVFAGDSDPLQPAGPSVETSKAASLRIDPSFVNGSVQAEPYDLAVIDLAAPFDLGPDIRPIALAAVGSTYPGGSSVTIAGYGRQSSGTPASGQLYSMSATLDVQGSCGVYTRSDIVTEANATLACAVSSSSSICSGDDGAGVVTTRSGSPTLVGVMEFSTGNCRPGSQAILVYIGAPSLLGYIGGDDHPPAVPEATNNTDVSLGWDTPTRVGATVTCSTRAWQFPVHVTYTFIDVTTGKSLQAGPQSKYRVAAKTTGHKIGCQARVATSGGTLLLTSRVTTGKVTAKQSKR
jgi:secreted trypsin-like serine protease